MTFRISPGVYIVDTVDIPMATTVVSLKSFQWARGWKLLLCYHPNLLRYADETPIENIEVESHVTGKRYGFHHVGRTTEGPEYYSNDSIQCPLYGIYIGSGDQMERLKRNLSHYPHPMDLVVFKDTLQNT